MPPPLPAGKPAPTLTQTFEDIAKAAANRQEEGSYIFSPIAALWDTYLQTDAVRKLPVRHRKPLTALCNKLTSVAIKHYNAYLKGIYPVQKPRPQPSTLPASDTTTTPTLVPTASPSPPITYAQAAAIVSPPQPARRTPLRTAKPITTRPDTRLFVRVAPGH